MEDTKEEGRRHGGNGEEGQRKKTLPFFFDERSGSGISIKGWDGYWTYYGNNICD